ncbi:hypothetical protein HU200_040300 [Digitaria exilis]|uniref:Uncharacterized protein n=1 Tax=Digitaria exilis TaxID=1010633 RepID=A0A835BJY4_9POAL|nr:hypothetical protein HU200_040300 [Digitaria exilis]
MVTLEEIRALPPPAMKPFYPRPLQWGTRSIKEPRTCNCSECGNVNDLTRHLVFDLPAFRCKACNAEPGESTVYLRFMSTLLGQPLSEQGPFIDIDDLLFKYEKRWLAEGNLAIDHYTGWSVITMIEVFMVDGVRQKNASGLHNDSDKSLKVSDWAWVNQNDFAAMSSAEMRLCDTNREVHLERVYSRLGVAIMI